MLKSIDEIIRKFASSMDEEVEFIDPKDVIELNDPAPTPTPATTNIDPAHEVGSAEWAAANHPQDFLLGVKHPYRGWLRDPRYASLVKQTMDNLIANDPENYFSWNLNRRQELKPWLYPAAKALIDKDPVSALMKEMYRMPELQDLNIKLWDAVLESEINRSAFDKGSTGEILSNKLFNKMRHLAGKIATSDPDFYDLRIAGKKITTKEFDAMAERNKRQKEELGKLEQVKLPYKTKF